MATIWPLLLIEPAPRSFPYLVDKTLVQIKPAFRHEFEE